MHAWYVCIRNKHTLSLSLSLSNLLFVVPFSFTHILFLHTHSFSSHALDLSWLRHSLRSIAYRFIEKSNITKFDHVRGEKELHLVRQTYTIRFTMRCSFVWCIFGFVDINNICINLINVSKVWLLKKFTCTTLSSGWNISFPLSAIWRTTQSNFGIFYISFTG